MQMATYNRMKSYLSSVRDVDVDDGMDDFFSGSEVIDEKPEKNNITPEYEYIETCFLDFKDVYKLKIKTRSENRFEISIKIEERKSSTFGSYKDYYNNISENMNNIDESLLKVRMKYPHSNITVSVNERSIDLKVEI